MICDVLDLWGLVVVRQDHGIALRRQPPDLRPPIRADLRSAGLGSAGLAWGRLSTGHDLPLSPVEVLDFECKTLFASWSKTG
jgi:hypothetical protein